MLYWCVVRVVVSFCAHTGVALAAQIGSMHQSEQALAVRLLLAAATRALYVGDRNFGVWRVVRAAAQSGGEALVRLTRARANKLAAGRRLQSGLDLPVHWIPSARDQVDRGLKIWSHGDHDHSDNIPRCRTASLPPIRIPGANAGWLRMLSENGRSLSRRRICVGF